MPDDKSRIILAHWPALVTLAVATRPCGTPHAVDATTQKDICDSPSCILARKLLNINLELLELEAEAHRVVPRR